MDPAEQYAYQQYLETERQRERDSRSLKTVKSACRPFADIDKEDADRAWRVAESEAQARIRAEGRAERWMSRYDKAVWTAYIVAAVGFGIGLWVGALIASSK